MSDKIYSAKLTALKVKVIYLCRIRKISVTGINPRQINTTLDGMSFII